MGFFDDIVKVIDRAEAGVNKAVDSLERAAEKPEQVLGQVEAQATKVTKAVDELPKPE